MMARWVTSWGAGRLIIVRVISVAEIAYADNLSEFIGLVREIPLHRGVNRVEKTAVSASVALKDNQDSSTHTCPNMQVFLWPNPFHD